MDLWLIKLALFASMGIAYSQIEALACGELWRQWIGGLIQSSEVPPMQNLAT